MIYIHRFLRLTPMYMLIYFASSTVCPLAIGVQVTKRPQLLKYTGSGPFWYRTQVSQRACNDDWYEYRHHRRHCHHTFAV